MFLSHLKALRLLEKRPNTNIVQDLIKSSDQGITTCIIALQNNEISAIRTEAHLRFMTELLGYSLRLNFTPRNQQIISNTIDTYEKMIEKTRDELSRPLDSEAKQEELRQELLQQLSLIYEDRNVDDDLIKDYYLCCLRVMKFFHDLAVGPWAPTLQLKTWEIMLKVSLGSLDYFLMKMPDLQGKKSDFHQAMANYFIKLWIYSGVKKDALFRQLEQLSANWMRHIAFVRVWVPVCKGFTKRVAELIFKVPQGGEWSAASSRLPKEEKIEAYARKRKSVIVNFQDGAETFLLPRNLIFYFWVRFLYLFKGESKGRVCCSSESHYKEFLRGLGDMVNEFSKVGKLRHELRRNVQDRIEVPEPSKSEMQLSGVEIKPRFGNAAHQEDIERNLRQLLKETEIIQQGPEISDRKSVLFLVPPANTLFELFGDWLFAACHQVIQQSNAKQGTMKEALKIIGKIVTKFRGPVDEVYLALFQMHLKRFFHDRSLSNSIGDYRQLMGSADTLFSWDIPGIRSLAPLFLDKIIDALSQQKATFELKSSAVRLLSQLICLAGNLRDDKRSLEDELAKKREEQLHTVFEFKQKLGTLNLQQLVFGLKQLDAKLFSTALWVYVVYLQANFQPIVLSEFITRLIQEVLEPKILTHLFSDPISILCHTIFNIIAYADWILCRSEGATSSAHLNWIMKLTEYLKYLYNIFKENGLQTAKTLCKSLILTVLRLLMMHPLGGRGVIIQNFLEVLLKITALTKGSLRDFAHFSFSFLEAHWNRIVPSSQTTCSLSSVLDANAQVFFAERGLYLLVNDTKLVVAVEQPHPTAFNDLLLLVRDSHGRFVYRTQLLLDCQRGESGLREQTTNAAPRQPPPPLGYYLQGRQERHRGGSASSYDLENEKQSSEEDDLLLDTIDTILQANIKIENEFLRRETEDSKINYEERYDQSMINHNQGSVLRVLLSHLGLIDAFESKVSILDRKNEQLLSDISMLDQISEKIAHQIPVLYIEKPECLLLNEVGNAEAHHIFQDFLAQLGPKITEHTLVTGLFQQEARSVLKRYKHFHHFSDIFNDLFFVAPSTLEGVSLKEVKALSNVAIVWNARVSGPSQNNKTPLLVQDLLKHPSGKLIIIITPLQFRLFCLSVLIKRGKEYQDLESLAGEVGPITEGMIVPKALLGPLITHTCLAFLRYDYSSPSYSYSGYGVFGEKVPDKFEDATVAALIDKYRRREECVQSLKKYGKNTSHSELIKLLQETVDHKAEK